MSTVAPETSPSASAKSLENLLLEYQEGAVIIRSQDSYEFRVPKLYLIHNSPALKEEFLISPNPQPDTSVISAEPDVGGSTGDLVVHLSCHGTILISPLSYIFPVPPVLPSTTEQIMELLSVAQMYKMDVVLTHIKNHIAPQQPPLILTQRTPPTLATASEISAPHPTTLLLSVRDGAAWASAFQPAVSQPGLTDLSSLSSTESFRFYQWFYRSPGLAWLPRKDQPC